MQARWVNHLTQRFAIVRGGLHSDGALDEVPMGHFPIGKIKAIHKLLGISDYPISNEECDYFENKIAQLRRDGLIPPSTPKE